MDTGYKDDEVETVNLTKTIAEAQTTATHQGIMVEVTNGLGTRGVWCK